MVTIDQARCKQCYTCLAECTYPYMFVKDAAGFLSMNPQAERFCIRCGHCVAVCPNHALNLDGMRVEELAPVQKALSILPEQAEQFLKSRRSIRTYKTRPLAHKKLQELMEITRWAATASNTQAIHWVVVETPARTHQVAGLVVDWMRAGNSFAEIVAAWEQGLDLVLRGAPHLAVACVDAARFWGFSEAAIALTYLELAAYAFGLGTCWAGYLTRAAQTYAPIREALGIPEALKVCGAMMIGYPKFRYRMIPNREALKIRWM